MLFEIATSKNLTDLIANLNEFINFKDTARSKNDILSQLHQQLVVDISLYRTDKPYGVFRDAASVRAYLLSRWVLQNSYNDNLKQLTAIIEEAKANMVVPTESRVSGINDKLVRFMKHLESRFETSNVEKLPLDFYIVDLYGESEITVYRLNSGSATRNMLFLYHNKNGNFQRWEYNLAISIGYILCNALTHTTAIPQSFTWLREVMFPKGDELSQDQYRELFAACFAIAALHNSEYSNQDPNTVILEDDKQILSSYITALLKAQGDISNKEFAALIQGKPHIDLSGIYLN